MNPENRGPEKSYNNKNKGRSPSAFQDRKSSRHGDIRDLLLEDVIRLNMSVLNLTSMRSLDQPEETYLMDFGQRLENLGKRISKYGKTVSDGEVKLTEKAVQMLLLEFFHYVDEAVGYAEYHYHSISKLPFSMFLNGAHARLEKTRRKHRIPIKSTVSPKVYGKVVPITREVSTTN